MADLVTAYVGIGSNVDRERNITGGLIELNNRYRELCISSVYESRSFGFTGDNFYNLVAGFITDVSLEQLCEDLRLIEYQFGRERNQEKYSARTLDIDLLLYGDEIRNDEKFVIPRPDIEQYSFVLLPLSEIAASKSHPVLKSGYQDMWNSFSGEKDDVWPSGFIPQLDDSC